MNKEIEALQNDIYLLERDHDERVDELRAQIEHIRSSCDHERDDNSGLTNPWWCGKCGGPMPVDPALDRHVDE